MSSLQKSKQKPRHSRINNSRQKTTVVLFNYGGGMRGLIPAHFMSAIEARTGLHMTDMIDIFAGPSTGAILNAAITRRNPDSPDKPLYRARHMVKFYEREGIKIFPPDSFRSFRGILHDFNNRTLRLNQMNWLLRHGHYDPANLGRALKALYGDSRLSESLSSLIIPIYNIDGEQLEVIEEADETGDTPARTKNNFSDEGGHAVWLKNINTGHPPGIKSQAPDVSLYDAVMASCAAPTYFPCHHLTVGFPDEQQPGKTTEKEFSAIDGNIFDNPCISYLGAIRRHIPPENNLVMIVLGTGYTNRSFKKDDWNRFGSLGVVDPVNDLPLINIFFHASETALMEGFAEEVGENLYVFNKSMITGLSRPGAASTQIDDASPENLRALRHFHEEILEENKSQFDDMCDLLVRNYEYRQEQPTAPSGLGRKLGHYLTLLSGKGENRNYSENR